MAAVLVRVAMLIVDTNPHSSMVDEDENERVPESILLGTVSEDGRGHVGATSLLRGIARAISNVWPIPLRFATLRVRGRLGDGFVQSPGVYWSLLGSEAVIVVRGTLGDAVLDGALIWSGDSTMPGLHSWWILPPSSASPKSNESLAE